LQKNRSVSFRKRINTLKDNQRPKKYLSLKIVTYNKKIKNVKILQIKHIETYLRKRLGT
jgi:hypothetical protein